MKLPEKLMHYGTILKHRAVEAGYDIFIVKTKDHVYGYVLAGPHKSVLLAGKPKDFDSVILPIIKAFSRKLYDMPVNGIIQITCDYIDSVAVLGDVSTSSELLYNNMLDVFKSKNIL